MKVSGSIGDVYSNVFLHSITQENFNAVRAMCEHPVTGEKYEIVGIDRGNGEVVPLFLIPVGGASTIIDYYKLVADDPAIVNPFIADGAVTTPQ